MYPARRASPMEPKTRGARESRAALGCAPGGGRVDGSCSVVVAVGVAPQLFFLLSLMEERSGGLVEQEAS